MNGLLVSFMDVPADEFCDSGEEDFCELVFEVHDKLRKMAIELAVPFFDVGLDVLDVYEFLERFV